MYNSYQIDKNGGTMKLVKNKTASFDVDAQKGFTPICPDELPVAGGDEIVDALRRAFLDEQLLGDALAHQAAGGCRAYHVHLVFHRRRYGGLENRCAEFLAVARIGVGHDDDQLVSHVDLLRCAIVHRSTTLRREALANPNLVRPG